MPTKPIIAQDPDDPSKRYQLVNNSWVPIQNPVDTVPKVDPNFFRDAQFSLEDIDKIKNEISPLNTGTIGWMTRNVGGTPGYDLNTLIKSIQGRGVVRRSIEARNATSTGASPLGQLTDKDAEFLIATLGNIDTGQSTGQFKEGLDRSRDVLTRSTPGLTKDNAIDLSQGQSRTLIPKGAYYKDKEGNIRRNDNMDKGNPIIVPRGGNIAKGIKASGATNLKAKYGLE